METINIKEIVNKGVFFFINVPRKTMATSIDFLYWELCIPDIKEVNTTHINETRNESHTWKHTMREQTIKLHIKKFLTKEYFFINVPINILQDLIQ